MTTIYKNSIVIFAPELLISNANNLVACFGASAADLDSFGPASLVDAAGNRFSLISTVITDATLAGLVAGVAKRPKWDGADATGKYRIDMVKAQSTFDGIVKLGLRSEKILPADPEPVQQLPAWDGETALKLPLDKHTSLVNVDLEVALRMYGLVRIGPMELANPVVEVVEELV